MKMMSGRMGTQGSICRDDACKRRYASFVDGIANYIGKLCAAIKNITRIQGVVKRKIRTFYLFKFYQINRK